MTSKISQDAAEAFLAGREFKRGNTSVRVVGLNVRLVLNDLVIAFRNIGEDYFSIFLGDCNRITLERLNAFPGVQLNTRRGCLRYNGNWISPFIKSIRVDYNYIDFEQLEQVLEA